MKYKERMLFTKETFLLNQVALLRKWKIQFCILLITCLIRPKNILTFAEHF